jgi:hypothetical protein
MLCPDGLSLTGCSRVFVSDIIRTYFNNVSYLRKLCGLTGQTPRSVLQGSGFTLTPSETRKPLDSREHFNILSRNYGCGAPRITGHQGRDRHAAAEPTGPGEDSHR